MEEIIEKTFKQINSLEDRIDFERIDMELDKMNIFFNKNVFRDELNKTYDICEELKKSLYRLNLMNNDLKNNLK